MAGEWIKMRVDLADDPAVIRIRRATGIDRDAVVGKLHRLWAWADAHTADGFAEGLDAEWVDEFTGCQGFASAMTSAGWLDFEADGIRFANFDRHNGKPAKVRALGKTRMQRIRCATSATESEQQRNQRREEKRREEKKKEHTQARSRPADAGRSKPADSISWDSSEGWQGITDADREAWATAYPACDIRQELARADQWLKANPTKATRKAWRRFITSWLSRTQDRGGSKTGQGQPATTPKEARKFWRAEFDRKMTDAEYTAAMRQRRSAGSVSLDLARTLTAEVRDAS